MKIERVFTTKGRDSFESIEFTSRKSEIRIPNGTIVFSWENVSVPQAWSKVATDIPAQKCFWMVGIRERLQCIEEDVVADWHRRSATEGEALGTLSYLLVGDEGDCEC